MGSLMRHAGRAAGPVVPLAVAVVQAPFRALLVPAAGGAQAPDAPLVTARWAAAGVAAITGAAEEERPAAQAAGAHAEDLQGPAGPEMSAEGRQSGGGMRHVRGAAHAPAGWTAPEGLELAPPGPHPLAPPGQPGSVACSSCPCHPKGPGYAFRILRF